MSELTGSSLDFWRMRLSLRPYSEHQRDQRCWAKSEARREFLEMNGIPFEDLDGDKRRDLRGNLDRGDEYMI